MAKRKAVKAEMTGTERRVLLLRSGEKVPVFAEDGRFYYCGTTRFRKANADILKVETVRAEKEEADGKTDSEKPRKDAETAE